VSERWEAVDARSRGLSGHLLGADALADLERAPDLARLADRMVSAGVAADPAGDRSPAGLELAVRRAAAGELRTLLRWVREGSPLAALVADLEDRRALRALVRGAAAGVASESRLSGLVPTPALPERLLAELARRATPAEVGALLAAWGHPYGAAILAAGGGKHPDLFRVEHAIALVFAERETRIARHGGATLRRFVADLIDFDNLRIALLLAGTEPEVPARTQHLPGGLRIDPARFAEAIATGDAGRCARVLAAGCEAPVAALVTRHARRPAALEAALETWQLGELERQARLDPLGAAPALRYLLLLRAQTIALGRLVWRVSMGAALSGPAA
jgi:vacuolar-type H+-ATPase subunit C/Vma6